MIPNRPRYAARLNAFKTRGGDAAQMIAAAAEVGGLSAVDLNYPDHFDGTTPARLLWSSATPSSCTTAAPPTSSRWPAAIRRMRPCSSRSPRR